MVAIDNRYEGAYVVRRLGWWYLFASSGDCCAGPTTGYSVFVGRSRSLRGPFVDRDGVRLDESRVGGTIVITPNGNRWVGTGHNAVVRDLAGQDWFVYHAIDRNDPYLDAPFAINERPMLIDRLDWIGGWPTVRAGRHASDTPQRAPATSVQRRHNHANERPVRELRPGRSDPDFGDEFNGALEPQWSLVRAPAPSVVAGELIWPTSPGDLFKASNTAPVLLRDAPAGEYTVETSLEIDLGTDTVRNFQQAGLVVYVHDDLLLRFTHVAIWNTRQTEFGKEMPFADGIAYGSMSVGPPADRTWLRLDHSLADNGEHLFRAYSSRDGRHWIRGGVWTLPAGTTPRIGVISMGGSGATAEFDYVRTYRPRS
jgi:arabinan endo-1,5-alpha-L-arabinosidase